MELRNLTPDEIYQLEQQGCMADDWMNVLVKEKFKPSAIWNTTFEKQIVLGDFSTPDPLDQKPGIFHSQIINCEIGDSVRIEHVKRLENYTISDACILENIGELSVTGETSFGNGTKIDVLNEAGGRSLMLYDTLSAQIAWLMVTCRHEKAMISQLENLIRDYTVTKKSTKGSIGQNTIIRHCTQISNVTIGEHSQLTGVQHLQNGTILSSIDSSTKVGDAVIASDFIIQEGSLVTDAAILDKCFIGQAVRIGKQFSAENSAFFSNSECFHGEACSVFGGPYTVTHHKSSLLIAGQYSFFNAGSGTNQSNHMYKLGPMHQGIVERGGKTGSLSYMLWPSHVGPFSVVMGKHTTSFDAADFPFSYITEEHGKSMLTPAMNLFTVGTKRDIQKWPARDRRSTEKYDHIVFDFYSPHIIQKVITAIDKLHEAYTNTPKEQESVYLRGLSINRLMLKTARKYYELALQVFFGEGIMVLLNKLKSPNSITEIQQQASLPSTSNQDQWLDVFGLVMPASQLEKVILEIKRGSIKKLQQVHDYFYLLFKQYPVFKTEYFRNLLKERRNIDLSSIAADQIIQLISEWKTALLKLNNMILKDAEKEYDSISHIGYGISKDKAVINEDFENVHGKFDKNRFVSGLKAEMDMINKKAEELISGFSQEL